MHDHLILAVAAILGLIALAGGYVWREAHRAPMLAELYDKRPCKGANANVCVAEGCYGEACRGPETPADAEWRRRLARWTEAARAEDKRLGDER